MSEPTPIPAPRLSDAGAAHELGGEWSRRLVDRRIAVAARADGQRVLIRPDCVLARSTGGDDEHILDEAVRLGMSPATGAHGLRRIGRYVRLDVEPDLRRGRWSVEPVSRSIEAMARRGLKVRPNHVYLANARGSSSTDESWAGLGLVDHPSYRANAAVLGARPTRTTARPAASPTWRTPLRLVDRTRPRVLVLDTGLCTTMAGDDRVAEHPQLRSSVHIHPRWRSARGVRAIDDEDEPHADRDGYIDLCGGHGTFITGLVLQGCPDAEVHVGGVLSSFGDGDDDSIESGIRRATQRIAPDVFDIVVLCLGAHTADDRFPPLAGAITELAADPRTLVIASAGNDGSARPYYPAAMPEVVAVGALAAGRRAWFSNFGGWVDACAPGVDVVSTYFCGAVDAFTDGETRFDGWASWSGTSFAAPKVAAAIAQQMYLDGGTSTDAWRRLSSWRRARVPDLGVVFDPA